MSTADMQRKLRQCDKLELSEAEGMTKLVGIDMFSKMLLPEIGYVVAKVGKKI